jgi:predicted nucleic acid-binding protein
VRFLLDTNLLIIPPTSAFLAAHANDVFLTAALSYAELLEGEFAPDPAVRAGAAAQAARSAALYGPGLAFDADCVAAYRAVCHAGARVGRRPARARRVDLMIAAVAVANGCSLLTRNTSDFSGLGAVLRVFDPQGPT